MAKTEGQRATLTYDSVEINGNTSVFINPRVGNIPLAGSTKDEYKYRTVVGDYNRYFEEKKSYVNGIRACI